MPQYMCTAIEARLDGSGDIAYNVWACDNDGNAIPGRHKTVIVPGAKVAAAEALETNQLRNAEHKRLLLAYAGPGWDDDTLNAIVVANQEASDITATVNERLTLPVTFTL